MDSESRGHLGSLDGGRDPRAEPRRMSGGPLGKRPQGKGRSVFTRLSVRTLREETTLMFQSDLLRVLVDAAPPAFEQHPGCSKNGRECASLAGE